jgi:hypothetical protein
MGLLRIDTVILKSTVINLVFTILCCTLLCNNPANPDGRGSAAWGVGQRDYHHWSGVPIG